MILTDSQEESGRQVLMHELVHVWQFQRGGYHYMPRSVRNQLNAAIKGGDRNGAYDWERAYDGGKDWHEWNPEQQAAAGEDYRWLSKLQPPQEDLDKLNAIPVLIGQHRVRLSLPEILRRGLGIPPPNKLKAAGTGTAGAVIGGVLGGALGGPIGAVVGAVAGGTVGAWFGI